MDSFPRSQDPDEGYSEDPLMSAGTNLARLRDTGTLPTWLLHNLASLPPSVRTQLAMAILQDLPTSAVADIVRRLRPRLHIDFASYLPTEICFKILGYLDPVSLINVAKSCRAYHTLAVDRKLWEALYLLEGWKVIRSEIDASEAHVNQAHHHPRSFLRHTTDLDTEMMDAGDIIPSGPSIFGGPGAGSVSAAASDKGKGVLRPYDELVNGPDYSPPTEKSNLWVWDGAHRRYKLDWKYLYAARRRLEANWEAGAFNNFQLPHPDFASEGHGQCIYNLQYNSEYLVSGSRDRSLRIWDLHTRRLVRKPLMGHNGSVLCLQFDSDPDEDIIVSGSSDSDVIIWRFSTGEMLQRLKNAHTESVLNVKFDKRILVTCSKDKTIKVFNRQPLLYGDLGYPRTIGESQAGQGPQGVVRFIDPVPIAIDTYMLGHSPRNTLPVIAPYTMIRCLEGHSAAVNAVQIHGSEVVSASGDRHIKVWDWNARACRRTLVGHTKGIACVQYDGRRIVSGSNDNEVKVFDKETSLEVASLRAHSELVRTVQAGFGDLPHSVEEDMADARAVDAEYFKAVESGAIPAQPTMRRRPRNAGSRRPEDITAYGAKLPPGGGGGRYGRIVSGSYDQSIIIWRRDKEGIWKVAHTLHQEEASAAARRQALLGQTGVIRLPVNHHQMPQQQDHPGLGPPATPQSQRSFQALIDSVIPQGPMALTAALLRFPSMVHYHTYMQTAIGRDPDPFTRSQLRQVVATHMVRVQMAHSRDLAPGGDPSVSASADPAAALTSTPQPAMAGGQGQQQQQQVQQGQQPQHHPHIANANANAGATGPSRVFKLQFDARRIICCSQTSDIVGWDFCNGDPELEEASRFFATID